MRALRVGNGNVRVLLLAAILAAATGCNEKMVITQVPEFYTPALKSIAIAPFRNQTKWRGAGEILSDKVATGLMANGSYRVFTRSDMRTVMDESDLRIALGADPDAAARQLSKLTDVQAVLVGTVTTYAATRNSQPRRDPIYATNRRGQSYVSGYRSYVVTRNEANVSVTAALIRVPDGTTIYATPQPVWARAWAQGSPPAKDAHACTADAASNVAAQLVETFAPVRKQIKIDPRKALRTATELYDNEWNHEDTFKVTDEKMFVVVSLPPSCDRNRFRLVVVRKDQRQELASKNIRWSKKHKGFGYEFSPKAIAAAGGGPGDFEVKFYSGPEPIMRRKFRVR